MEIENLLNDKINGFISYEEWSQLVNNLLEYNNNNEIIKEIIDFIKKRNMNDERYKNKNDTDNKLNILFKDFIKILLEI